MEWNLLNITALAGLTLAVADDLRTRKVHNAVILAILIASVTSFAIHFYLTPTASAIEPLKSFGLASVIGVGLFALRVWGGGDAKLYMALSPLLLFHETPIYLLCSMIWGSVLGLTTAALNARLGTMATNLTAVLMHRKGVDQKQLVKVPFSVALFFGYLSLMVLRQKGVV